MDINLIGIIQSCLSRGNIMEKDLVLNNIVKICSDYDSNILNYTFDEENFGNICIYIEYENIILFRFIRERGEHWTEIIIGKDSLYFDDFLLAIHILEVVDNRCMETLVKSSLDITKRYRNFILQALNKKNFFRIKKEITKKKSARWNK